MASNPAPSTSGPFRNPFPVTQLTAPVTPGPAAHSHSPGPPLLHPRLVQGLCLPGLSPPRGVAGSTVHQKQPQPRSSRVAGSQEPWWHLDGHAAHLRERWSPMARPCRSGDTTGWAVTTQEVWVPGTEERLPRSPVRVRLPNKKCYSSTSVFLGF